MPTLMFTAQIVGLATLFVLVSYALVTAFPP